MRKKRADMTPVERTEYILTGASWDDAEKAGVEILARCMALHVYARKDGEEYFAHLMKNICKRADEWRKEPGNARILAFASLGNEIESAGGLEDYLKKRKDERKRREVLR